MDSLSMYDLNVIIRGVVLGYLGISGTLQQLVCLFGPSQHQAETPETMMSKELWMFVGSATTSGVRDGVNLHSDRWTGSTPHGKPANYASQLLCFSELSRSSGLRLGGEGEAGRDQGRLSCGGNLEAKVGQKTGALSQLH